MLSSPANATEFHPLEEIREAATTLALQKFSRPGDDSTVEAGHLDPRLRLKKCALPLTAEPLSHRSNNTNMTVIVKCDDAKPWTVYVPVKIKIYLTVAVVNRPLARGIPINKSDISFEKRELSRLTSGYFETITGLVGHSPRRSLSKGSIVSPRDLAIQKVIRKGSSVSIVAETNGITVRMPGKALTDAGKGDQIKVENLSSRRTVIGIVLGPGIVEVAM